ncbi:MAG TPA: MerR family transcriptional regulator [Marmoricola sp.]|nr:MerR family transcriptional regulator [Marmoricola sp.]
MANVQARMRIGELARRTGVTPELLRAWEQRYGLLRPERSRGGFRLYSGADEERVRRTTALIETGVSAGEAARQAAETHDAETRAAEARAAKERESEIERPVVEVLAGELQEALDRFDAVAANDVLDRLFGAVSVDYAVSHVLIPYLHELGERWADGTVNVAQEHFASHLLRGRLLGLAGDWGVRHPRTALLACLPGEAHDLGLVMLGLLLQGRGWRVAFLGADTPVDTIEESVPMVRPSLVVLGTYRAKEFRAHRDAVARLAAVTRVAVAGPVEEKEVADLGAELLANDIVAAAEHLGSS